MLCQGTSLFLEMDEIMHEPHALVPSIGVACASSICISFAGFKLDHGSQGQSGPVLTSSDFVIHCLTSTACS